MRKLAIMDSMSRTLNRAGLKLKKHSPEIMLVAGAVGVVTSAVMACKATTKINTIIEDAKEQVDVIHSCTETGDVLGEDYTPEDGKKDLAIVYAQTGLKFVKLYGPSVVLGAASLGCMIASNRILRKRNVALAAAYATIDRSFKGYRGNVIDRFGEAMDKELKYNIQAKEIEETVMNEDGTESTVKKTVEVAGITGSGFYSPYAVVFCEGSLGWEKNAETNKFYLLQQQRYANDKLVAQGHLFLNEVYDMLGYPRTTAGAQVGWVYDPETPNGDNYVDFGIFDIYSEKACDFVNGYERSVVLDFNVDGVILDMI